MRRIEFVRAWASCLLALGLPGAVSAQATPIRQTIVLLRHAEKPAAGLGQLSCKGFNRALALPTVLEREFGRPDALFAPNPGVEKSDEGVSYNYLRPLATIEPTAIRAGLPVDTRHGYADVEGLVRALRAPGLRGATVFVAWEHKQLVKVARLLVSGAGGAAKSVPKWPGTDFDSLYVIRIEADAAGSRTAVFKRQQQGLDGLAEACPDLPR